MSAVVFAASFFKNDNVMETIHNLAIPAVAVVGLFAIIKAFRGHIGAAIVMGLIALIGLGFIGLSSNANEVAKGVGDIIRGMLP